MSVAVDVFPVRPPPRRASEGQIHARQVPRRPAFQHSKLSFPRAAAASSAIEEEERPASAPPVASTSAAIEGGVTVATPRPTFRSTNSSASLKRLSKNRLSGLFAKSPTPSSTGSANDDDSTDAATVRPAIITTMPLSLSASSALDSPTWQSALSPTEYEAVLRAHGSREVLRQELIHELCETERLFLRSVRELRRLFVNPLKNVNGQWVSGVPPRVSRFYECLDEVVAVHMDLARAFDKAKARAGGRGRIVRGIAHAFEGIVERFESYLPYLTAFERVTADEIERRASDLNDTFGEFVRLQSSSPECGGLSLSSWLHKPIQRLMKYPLFLRQLKDATETRHAECNEILRLYDTIDGMIRSLQEVQTREDEYARLKTIESSLGGRPLDFTFAVRDRRLLWEGSVSRVHVIVEGPSVSKAATYASEVRRRSSHSQDSGHGGSSSGSSSGRNSADWSGIGTTAHTSSSVARPSNESESSIMRAVRTMKKMPRLKSSPSGVTLQNGNYVFVFEDTVVIAHAETVGDAIRYHVLADGVHGQPYATSEVSDTAIRLECGTLANELRLPRQTTQIAMTLSSTRDKDQLAGAIRSSRHQRPHARPRLLTAPGLVRSPSEIGRQRAAMGKDELAREGGKLDKEERVFWSFRLEQVRRDSL